MVRGDISGRRGCARQPRTNLIILIVLTIGFAAQQERSQELELHVSNIQEQ